MMASCGGYQGSFLSLPPWKISDPCCVLVSMYTYLMAPFIHLLLTLYLAGFSSFSAEKLFSVWFMSLLCNGVSVCDDQVRSCNGHGRWFSSICSLPDYRSEPIMIAFSSLVVIGSAVTNAGKFLRKKKKNPFPKRISEEQMFFVWKC